MGIINKENRLCLSCMKVHDIEIIEVVENNIFKNEPVEYSAIYEYCPNTDEYTETEELIKSNDLSFKDAYRKKINLLTSSEIVAIRDKYGVSQKDFSEILGWGKATITRYENHQVQDEAHDEILRKLNNDPKWFIELLKKNKDAISTKAYVKYLERANELFQAQKDTFLIDCINAMYAGFEENMTGRNELNLNKTVEVINYLALKVDSLFKVKLMKMLWFSDFLNFKRYNRSITGLAYNALKMGAVPVGYEQIVSLEGVCYEEILIKGNSSYKFMPQADFRFMELSPEEINTIDEVIKRTGEMVTEEIVNYMHEEWAYKCTNLNCIISYKYAKELSID